MLKELTNSIKVVLYERAISPLSGVFLAVWTIFNWKALAIFLWGEGEIRTKIAYLEAHHVDVWTNLYWPLIWTAAFIVAYPFLALGPYALWEMVAGWKVTLKQRFESTVALSVAQSVALRKELRDKEKEFGQSLESKDLRIAELDKQNQSTVAELSKLKEAVSSRGDAEAQVVTLTERLVALEAKLNETSDELNKAKLRETTLQAAMRTQEQEIQKMRSVTGKTSEDLWEEEYSDELEDDPKFKTIFQRLLQQVATPSRISTDADQRAYGVAKGLVKVTEKGYVVLTEKGQYLARHVY